MTAARRALASGEKTLVIYPLRALANDQFEAMTRKLDPFGLRVLRANGAISPDERAALFAALEDGSWDVILATPEFLAFHREAFSGPSVPRLVVVDEAHHLYESKHRPAYGKLGASIASLGSPDGDRRRRRFRTRRARVEDRGLGDRSDRARESFDGRRTRDQG